MKRLAQVFWGSGSPPTQDDLSDSLWNAGWTPSDATSPILEQYKMYVEMADRISARRGLTNTFFLTLNTAVLTTVGVVWAHPPRHLGGWLAIPLVVLLAECVTWFWLVRSYRQLNTAKYAVVGALEAKLPASPYWNAEWKALGEGMDRARYWPISHLEQGVPLLFAVAYGAGFLALVL
jgi:hypothetical protein